MVALIRPNNLSEIDSYAPRGNLRLVVNNDRSTRSGSHRSAPDRPSLEVVSNTSAFNETMVIAAAMAFVVFGFFIGIRLVQGSPDPALSLSEPGVSQFESSFDQGPIRPAGFNAQQTVVAEPGDSLWSIAVDLGAEGNVDLAVAALIEANGGESIVVGQQIIVPEQLVG